MQGKALHFVKGLSANLATRWENFFLTRLLFASVHSASMCLRESRVSGGVVLVFMMVLLFNLLFSN